MKRSEVVKAVNAAVGTAMIGVQAQVTVAALKAAEAVKQEQINRAADALVQHPRIRAAINAAQVEARRKDLKPAGYGAGADVSNLLRDALSGGR